MHRCASGEAVQSRFNAGEYMRRSLTVTPENDKKILLTKGRFLTGDSPLDIDYTTMINIFIELGYKVMSTAWNDNNPSNPNVVIDKNEIIESFKKHAFNSELKEESVGDLVTEIIFKKLVEQSGIGDQISQNQTPALPPEQPNNQETKKQKYIT
jgi:hypothetical protein